jgi:probable F420-dependent oxidoreductase
MTTPNDRLTSRADFGVCIPNFRPGAKPEGMLASVETAERLGWGTAWTTDHILIDDNPRGEDYRTIYESLSVLAWLGGQTTSVRLGISVLVVPMRNAVVLAKELATIDALTHGRLIVGVGIGWNRREFENVGVADRFAHRGAYLEETVAMWRHLWSGGDDYEGRFDSFKDSHFDPLPTQGAELPIWIGATAPKALERVGRIAHGYHSTRTSPAEMQERGRIIKAAADAAGRPMPVLSSRTRVVFDRDDGDTTALSGTSDQMVEEIRAVRDAGVSQLTLDFLEIEPEAQAQAMERFDREVVAAL